MNSDNKATFCKQLTYWLIESEWHFTTLLATTVESVSYLPDDADDLINKLLLWFPVKPSATELFDFLAASALIDSWFRFAATKPVVHSLNLDLIASTTLLDPKLPALESSVDLAAWLNITLGELEWLADLKRPALNIDDRLRHYHYSLNEKRRGGVRLIESPKSLLKEIQRKINSNLLAKVSVHNASHGFRVGRSCVTHAENHAGKNVLLLFDIASCFHSIQWRQAYRAFRSLGYAPEVTKYLTGLCTHQLHDDADLIGKLEYQQMERLRQRHLPQGAPSSPALSNIVMHQLDKRLTGLADSLQLSYSRYADDLAFSGNKLRDWRFLEPLVGSICLEEGFELNHRKSRIIKAHQRQKLTGIVVNQTTNIDRRYYDQLKATLHNCVRLGLENQNRNGITHFYEHLAGAVNYVSVLNKNRGAKLRKILRQIAIEN